MFLSILDQFKYKTMPNCIHELNLIRHYGQKHVTAPIITNKISLDTIFSTNIRKTL